MKKGIIVLLIMALVASFAFAGKLTGSAQIDFGYDLDKTNWGFVNGSSTKYTFSFEYDSTKVEVADHATDVWAEIAATASAKITQANAAQTAANIAVSAKITKANIHVGEWTFGILGAGSAADFAASYWLDDDGNPVEDTVVGLSAPVDGFTVSYKDWNGGFAAAGNIENKKYTVFAHVETPDFKFAEEAITVNAGAYALVNDAANAFGGSVAADYASDELSASVAADVAYANDTFVYEIAAAAAYKFVTLDVYATPGALMGTPGYAKEMSLNALVTAAYDFDVVAVEAYVDARDVLVDGRAITVAAKETATFGELKVVANEKYAVADKELSVDATVTHGAEKFTAYVKVGANFAFGASKVLAGIPFEYGISSTAVVENATLSLTYKGANLADFSNAMGKITASAKIAF